MPKALVINPNTTQTMTDEIAQSAARAFAPPWEAVVVQPPAGPASLETWLEDSLAVLTMLPVVKAHPDADGVVVACFGDPGLFGLREILHVPVVGVAEASFLTACFLGWRFGILVGPVKDVAFNESKLWTYGLEKRCAGIQTMDLSVLSMHAEREVTMAGLLAAGRALVARGAEVLILGCAGLTTYRLAFEQQMGVPVIDPVEAGCRQLRLLVEAGLATSRAGMYGRPAPKVMAALETVLAPGLADWLTQQAARGFPG